MSSIIKSFRVLERENVHKIAKDLEDRGSIDDISRETFLNEAKAEADLIIKIAEERAKQILEENQLKGNEIIQSASIESNKILEDAKKAGYAEGYEKGMEEGTRDGYEKGYDEGKIVSDKLIQESLEIKNDYIETRKALLEKLEGDVIQLVTDIYMKILDKEIEENENMIRSLVLSGLKNLDPTDKLTIIVSKEDFSVLEEAKDEILAKASLINELVIKYDINMSKGDCILETSKGSIDISIKNQIEEVRELLNTILNNE